jgi:predicted transporter
MADTYDVLQVDEGFVVTSDVPLDIQCLAAAVNHLVILSPSIHITGIKLSEVEGSVVSALITIAHSIDPAQVLADSVSSNPIA